MFKKKHARQVYSAIYEKLGIPCTYFDDINVALVQGTIYIVTLSIDNLKLDVSIDFDGLTLEVIKIGEAY